MKQGKNPEKLPLLDNRMVASSDEGYVMLNRVQVRVHIVEARALQSIDPDGICDPVCVVECFGKKKCTSTLENTSLAHWDRLFVFEKTGGNIFQKEVEREVLKITVFDANYIRRDVEVGSFEFALGGLRKESLKNKWIGLWGNSPATHEDKSKKIGIQGYLKISLSVLFDSEQETVNESEEEDEEDFSSSNLTSMVLLPPTVDSSFQVIRLNIFRAEGLPKMDVLGSVDSFLAVKFQGNPELVTKIIKKDHNPTWNQTILMTAHSPLFSDGMSLQLRDWDAGDKDDIIATHEVSLSEIEKVPASWSSPRWLHFYGAPGNRDANRGVIPGSCWRGRVLVSCTISQDTKTEKKRKNKKKKALTELAIKPTVMDIQDQFGRNPPLTSFEFLFCIFELAFLPKDLDGSIKISLSMGPSVLWESKKVKVKSGGCEFEEPLVFTSSLSIEDDPSQWAQLIIEIKQVKHMSSGDKRISFLLVNPLEHISEASNKYSEYQQNAVGIQWFGMHCAVSYDKHGIRSSAAGSGGYLQGGIEVRRGGGKGKLKELVDSQQVRRKREYELRGFIYQGRNLLCQDRDGSSDPYLVMKLGTSQVKTSIKKRTLFPIWNELLVLDCTIRDQCSPIISFEAFDWDKVGKNDPLGHFELNAADFLSMETASSPTWYKMTHVTRVGKVDAGEVLACFQFIEKGQVPVPIPKTIAPKAAKCVVRVSVVGLRDMTHFNLLPLNYPWIQFDCGGCEIKPVKTKKCKNPSGSDTMHLEVLDIQVDIPRDPIFAPPLNIKVFDDLKIHKPCVATRGLDLSHFLPWFDPDIEDKPRIVIPPEDEVEELETPLEFGEDKERELEEQTGADVARMRATIMGSINSASTRKPVKEIALGIWGSDEKKSKTKEKREVIDTELESVLDAPYSTYSLYRHGKYTTLEVGKLKAKVRVIQHGDESIEAAGREKESSAFRKMLDNQKLIVRIYVLEGLNLVPQDLDGTIEPYLKIKLKGIRSGSRKVVVDSKKNDIVGQNSVKPKFYQSFELPCDFPSQTKLTIEVWDKDRLLDDMVGKTHVDLEGRWNSDKWQSYPQKPAEWRTLWNPRSKTSQGHLKLWVDILTASDAEKGPMENISPPGSKEMELRVIVWEAKEVVFKDKSMSDILVSCFPHTQKPQVTDTHWRSEDGSGQFNWRMKFPLRVPQKSPLFHVQLWDKDLLSPDDVIGEAVLNLSGFVNKAFNSNQTITSLDKQWLKLHDLSGEELQGKVCLSFELLTQEEAMRRNCGFGRSEPNEFPHLPEPDRPDTAFNPLRVDKLIWKVFIRRHKWKIIIPLSCCCCCIIVFAILYIYLMIPKF